MWVKGMVEEEQEEEEKEEEEEEASDDDDEAGGKRGEKRRKRVESSYPPCGIWSRCGVVNKCTENTKKSLGSA